MEGLIEAVRTHVPGFLERALTFEDFLTACARDGIDVEIRRFALDEHLDRDDDPPRITLNAGLAGPYRTFAAFHALGHWYGHPAERRFYLGSPGWLDKIEMEASTIGLLALAPYRAGPPYPRLANARFGNEQLELWVEFPTILPAAKPAGRRITWKRRRTVLFRKAQMEFDWNPS